MTDTADLAKRAASPGGIPTKGKKDHPTAFTGKAAVAWLEERAGLDKVQATAECEQWLADGKIVPIGKHTKFTADKKEFTFAGDYAAMHVPTSLFDFEVVDIDDKPFHLSQFRGKVCLVLNVASACGLTQTNYKQLQPLYEKYHDQGLEILGFPCNQFLAQESRSQASIKQFVQEKYGVTFNMFSKIEVNGAKAHALFKWMRGTLKHTGADSLKWNFTKFLVDRNGQPVKRYSPKTEPNDLVPDIEALLEGRTIEAGTATDGDAPDN